MGAHKIKDIEITKTAVVVSISFTGNLEIRRDIREKLVKAYGFWDFKFLSYEDTDATGKEMGTLRLSRKG